ncbi:MAG: GTPase Era [Butyrivibrio sp.]|jgi:GTP-binding protein Era|nr:GTPase Era [Butyrivibrio sp.]
MENNFKTGYIALIGRPNVGKSTLMNQMIGQKIAITSCKPQTTRNKIMTVYTDEQCQMIFLDTPGIHETKNKLGEYMTKLAKNTLTEVDIVMWLVEPSTFIGAGEKSIIEDLKACRKPVILVINKIDTVSEDNLDRFEEAYRKEMDFAAVVKVAALKRKNIDGVMNTIRELLPVGPPFYDEDTLTDQPERQIVAEIIREKALRLMKDEVPHGIAVTIERMREREDKDLMDIEATIICERDSHKGIVIGKGGAMLKKIGSTARKDIEELVGVKVNLQLWVKVRKDWRDDKTQLKSFGYDVRGIN